MYFIMGYPPDDQQPLAPKSCYEFAPETMIRITFWTVRFMPARRFPPPWSIEDIGRGSNLKKIWKLAQSR
jgi:hypothetical protein